MNKDNVKLAIAPIGWTNDDMPELGSENTFQQIVSEMALAGFTGSEVGSKYPRDPASFSSRCWISAAIQSATPGSAQLFRQRSGKKPLMNSSIT